MMVLCRYHSIPCLNERGVPVSDPHSSGLRSWWSRRQTFACPAPASASAAHRPTFRSPSVRRTAAAGDAPDISPLCICTAQYPWWARWFPECCVSGWQWWHPHFCSTCASASKLRGFWTTATRQQQQQQWPQHRQRIEYKWGYNAKTLQLLCSMKQIPTLTETVLASCEFALWAIERCYLCGFPDVVYQVWYKAIFLSNALCDLC